MIHDTIKKAYNKYASLQKEDFFIDYDEERKLLVLRWHVFMDRFINLTRVRQVANFIRKENKEVEITDSFGNIY